MSRARTRSAKTAPSEKEPLPKQVNSYPPQRPRLVQLAFANLGGALLAGPYHEHRAVPADTFKVKMAVEIKAPCDVSVPTVDFGVPSEKVFKQALLLAATNLIKGKRVFVGCGYGIGRTGTFVAALFKLHREVLYRTRNVTMPERDWELYDPVEEARSAYYVGAVETKEQADFVRLMDLKWLSRWIAFRVKPLSIFDNRFWAA